MSAALDAELVALRVRQDDPPSRRRPATVINGRGAEHRGGEIGWVLHPCYSGHGYAMEASHALLHLALDQLGLHRVVARVDARNDASLRLGERLGVRREAHLVSNEWLEGAWSDEVDLALLDSEWAAQHAEGRPPCAWPPASPSSALPR